MGQIGERFLAVWRGRRGAVSARRSSPAVPLVYPGWEPLVPPRELWAGPDDPFIHFARWSWEYLAYLTLLCGLRRDGTVLEIGCNHGRTMLGLAAYLGPSARYEGLDVLPRQIAFAREAVKALPFPARFQVADVYNGAYNPEGRQSASTYRFPFPDATFDVAYAASVFTHLVPNDAENYLRETARVLKPGGRALYSFFVLDSYQGAGRTGASLYEFDHPLSADGEVAVKDPARPEAVIGFRKSWIERAVAAAGLSLLRVVPGLWPGDANFAVHEQDLVLLERPGARTGAECPVTDVLDAVRIFRPEPMTLLPVRELVVPGRKLVLEGTGFTAGSVIQIWVKGPGGIESHGPISPDGFGPTELTCNIPETVPPGGGIASVQVVNTDQGYVASNVEEQYLVDASVADARISVTSVEVRGSMVTLYGAGFCSLTVVNVFVTREGSIENLGGLRPDGSPRIRLNVLGSDRLTFERPASAPAGSASVEALNPPFRPRSDAGGAETAEFVFP